MSHLKDEAMVKCLLKEKSVTAGDSNSHSADQKHQSLNSVLVIAWPGHFHACKGIHASGRNVLLSRNSLPAKSLVNVVLLILG